jgi:nucleoside-diphosphate-sugar epimerase
MSNELTGRRALLTGGLGFLGLNVARALLDQGAQVRILNRSADPLALRWLAQLSRGNEVELIQGDIADGRHLPYWIDDVQLVINLAAESGAAKSLQEAHADMQVNIAGQLNLLDAIRARGSFPHLIFVSSRLVYGVTGSDSVGELHPTRPTSLYGLHKLTVEHYHRIYSEQYGIPYTVLRLTNPYGPYQLPQRSQYGVINRFIIGALRGETLTVYGDGGQLRDYLHSSDVARAVLAITRSEAAIGETLNVGFGTSLPLGEVARKIVALAGSGRIEEVEWPAGYRRVETGDFCCDISRIRRLTDWSPQIAPDEGLRQTISSYRELLP